MTVVFSLVAAWLLGTSDFFGGLASRTRSPIQVTAAVQAVSFLAMAPIALAIGAERLSVGYVALGGAGGIATGLAYLCFFAGLGNGRIAIVAPVTAGITAVVPVLISLAVGEGLSGPAAAGVGAVLLAIPLVAYSTDEAGEARRDRWPVSRQIGIAALAGGFFAVFYLVIGETPEETGIWPTVANTLVSALFMAAIIAARGPRPLTGGVTRASAASGLCLAVAAVVLTLALQRGPVVVATVISNLYPVATVGLGIVVLKESLRYWHLAGVALAVAGVGLIAMA